MKMRKLFVVCLALASFFACQEAPKNNATGDSKAELAAITDVVHNFYKWYETGADGMSSIIFVKGGLPTTIDNVKFDKYFAIIAKSGYFSQLYIDAERAKFKNLEATTWKNENSDEEPLSGYDYDLFLCSQEIEDFKLLTTAPLEVQGLGTEKVTAILDLEDYTAKKFELVKENGKWLISKITCN